MKTNTHTITSEKEIQDKKIAILSEVHLNRHFLESTACEIAEILRSETPSHILIPGNLYDVDETTVYSGNVVGEFISKLTAIAPVYYIRGEAEARSCMHPRGFYEDPEPNFYRICDCFMEKMPKEYSSDTLVSGDAKISGLKPSMEYYGLAPQERVAYLLSRYNEYLDRIASVCNGDSLNILLCQDPAIIQLYGVLDSLKSFDLVVTGRNEDDFAKAEAAYFSGNDNLVQKENTSFVSGQGCIDFVTVRARRQ